MEDKIRITVIATGFDGSSQPRPAAIRSAPARVSEPRVAPRAVPVANFPSSVLDSDDLDIPTFLRKRK
jgi:hypothetical protein